MRSTVEADCIGIPGFISDGLSAVEPFAQWPLPQACWPQAGVAGVHGVHQPWAIAEDVSSGNSLYMTENRAPKDRDQIFCSVDVWFEYPVPASLFPPMVRWSGPDIFSSSTSALQIFQEAERLLMGARGIGWLELDITAFVGKERQWQRMIFLSQLEPQASSYDTWRVIQSQIFENARLHGRSFVWVVIRTRADLHEVLSKRIRSHD
jgi:hypothetical protein